MESIENIAETMMSKDTPYHSLIYVVALLLFFFLVLVYLDSKTNPNLDKLFGFAKFILILLSVIFVFVILVGGDLIKKDQNHESESAKSISSFDLIGMYRGRIYPSDNNINSQIQITGQSRLDIEEGNLHCVIYSENEAIEQQLGRVSLLGDVMSEFRIPKIGWVKCIKTDTSIVLQNHPSRNNDYYFKFEKL